MNEIIIYLLIGFSAVNFVGLVILVAMGIFSSKNAGKGGFDVVEKELQANRKELNENLFQFVKMMNDSQAQMNQSVQSQLGQSFKFMSERLESLQHSLGEMQDLASGVNDLRKVMSNVKTKGVLGEYQLGSLLDQILTPNQYAKNVKTKEGSDKNVEFAIKIPSKTEKNEFIWLPIDSKFPTEDYARLLDAYDATDNAQIERSKKALETNIKKFAKDIADKYIDVPNTTDFGILFLPFEGLYAEVLRIPGLFESVQRELKITITGPTTLSAFISSLQMGFRTLAIEKRTQEIWNLLGAIKTEFGKFGDVVEDAQKNIDKAKNSFENIGTRTRAIQRKLREVEELPESEAREKLN